MARKGRSSIVHQVSQAITAINFIGMSKRSAKYKGESGIHSIKQIQETLSASQNFAKWVRDQHEIKSLYLLTEEHYVAYMGHLKDLGRSAGHRQNVETALRHLQKGMNLKSQAFRKDEVIFVPEKRVTDWRELKKAEDRSYSQEEYQSILPYLSENVRDAVKLIRFMGLRVREACNVQVRHFIPAPAGGFQLRIPEEEARGITKGGRYRITPVPDSFLEEIQRMLRGKATDETVISVKKETVRKGVNDAFKKVQIQQDGRGTHGFRHLYCRERLKELLFQNDIEQEGLKLLERVMSNRDLKRKADYGILSSKDIELYETLKAVIDQIHEEIGHGEDRWDLAERYMR